MERRDFIKTTTLAAMAPSLCIQSCGKDSVIPIIDTHVHLWELDFHQLKWVRPPIDRNFLVDDYLKAVAGQNVVKAIYMEVGAPPEIREKEADWALGLCKDPENPVVAAVIAKDPTEDGFAEYMQRFEGNQYLKGIWIKTLKEVVAMRPIEEQRKLFHDNAEKFYGL